MMPANHLFEKFSSLFLTLFVFVAVASVDGFVSAQENESPNGETPLVSQLTELREKITQLEAKLGIEETADMPEKSMDMKSMGKMKSMDKMKKKSPMKMGATMKKKSMGKMKSMKMGMGMMGQGSMGMMGKMRQKQMAQSALPGFPGTSHLYHIGSTGFFLNHADHISLSTQQQAKLNQFKEKALLSHATFERTVEQAEQDLWEMTSSDQPKIEFIEKKIREIEKVKGNQRLAFIRFIGKAAGVLTQEQQKTLTGMMQDMPDEGSGDTQEAK